MNNLSKNLKQAKEKLVKDGWIISHSVMASDTKNYGICFSKGEKTFWLNKDTVGALK